MDPNILKKMTYDSIHFYNKVFLNVNTENQLQNIGLTTDQSILQKQRRRLDVKDQRITMKDMGFQAIQNGNNLFKLVQSAKIQLLSVIAPSKNKIIFRIKATQNVSLSLQKGTILYPTSQRCEKSYTQSLIILDDYQTDISSNVSQFSLDTYCFNSELSAPQDQKYYLGNIKSFHYQDGMNQSQVWEISVKQKTKIKQIQQSLKRQDQRLIAFKKNKIQSALATAQTSQVLNQQNKKKITQFLSYSKDNENQRSEKSSTFNESISNKLLFNRNDFSAKSFQEVDYEKLSSMSSSVISSKGTKQAIDFYTCPITMQIMQKPCDLPCGHLFEGQQLRKMIAQKPQCPRIDCRAKCEYKDIRQNLVAQFEIKNLYKRMLKRQKKLKVSLG